MNKEKLCDIVSKDILQKSISRMLKNGGDFAEVFCERALKTSVNLDEDRIKESKNNLLIGTGLRLIAGGRSHYIYVNSIDEDKILSCANEIASGISSNGKRISPKVMSDAVSDIAEQEEYGEIKNIPQVLRDMNQTSKSVDSKIANVHLIYMTRRQEVLIANSDGVLKTDVRYLDRIMVIVTAIKESNRKICYRGVDLVESLDEKYSFLGLAREASEGAIMMLESGPAPAGDMPVVLANGRLGTGTVFHEGCGHALESDLVLSGTSNFSGKLGQMVASPLVTIVDDGTWSKRSGAFRYDDEGTPATKTILIDKGKLVGYMCDLKGAKALGISPTGNGQRESFMCPPIPRMRCTYLAGGDASPSDLISEVKKGLFVKTVGGGAGDIAGEGFVFTVEEAYLIEDGKITRPVYGATLHGCGLEFLKVIDGIGNDITISSTGGFCGKAGQMVPVADGCPTLRVSHLTVGGSAL